MSSIRGSRRNLGRAAILATLLSPILVAGCEPAPAAKPAPPAAEVGAGLSVFQRSANGEEGQETLKSNINPDEAKAVCMELKYCERCGGLWLRPGGQRQGLL